MEDFYTYILQVNVALIVFYLLYRLLFNRDTFFTIRRLFLLTVVLLSFTYSLFPFSDWLNEREPLQVFIVNYAELMAIPAVPAERPSEAHFFTAENICLLIWGLGMAVLLLRMLFQLLSVWRLALKGERISRDGVTLIALHGETAPFSFFGWIFINPCCHSENELQEIIVHEKAHVNQCHSLDMFAGELLCILFWFNPAVWFLRYEIRQNLEFLADKDVMNSGYNRKNYQYHLLRLTYQSAAVQIVNNFNVSQLKKRITMMNKKRTSRFALVKYALLLPVTGILILAGNAQAVARMTEEVIEKNVSVTDEVAIKGKVADEAGHPIAGVSVVIKGTNKGTVSDESGNFSIKGQASDMLVFSYVGKGTQVISFKNGTKDFLVTMKPQPIELKSFHVVGFPISENNEDTYMVVEKIPEFPGGEEKMVQFIAKSLKYPVKALEANVQGKVMVSFVVNEQGKITDTKVISETDKDLNTEALRVINSMPQWIPAMQRGKAVNTQMVVPIIFSLGSPEESSRGTVTTVTMGDGQDIKSSLKAVYQVGEQEKPPLFILNGYEVTKSEFESVSPEEIESITVLKDKASVSLYGDKGKDGVIVIQMKMAKEKTK